MNESTRDKYPSLALILLAMLALSMTAATINSTVGGAENMGGFNIDTGESADQGPNRDGERVGGNDTGESVGASDSGVSLQICIEELRSPTAIAGILLSVTALFYVVYRQFNAATTLLVGSAVGPLIFGAYFLLTNCPNFRSGSGSSGLGNPAAGSGLAQAPSIPPALIAAVLVGVLGLAVLMIVSVTRGDEQFHPVEDEEDFEAPEAADFAEAAGRAADRIEEGNASVDNAVYRAWLEMTNLLNIPDPESIAPMDFADAAIEAGLEADDVHELTELFNEVRYGHKDAESREDRAIEILRAIEAEYEGSMRDDTDRAESGGEQ
ncbi:DUF4129 domain-containing protein [Halosimplex amylolyticum]|uniref:DUF4129 domain-containing protein n=1 Tax=Halosimplex amylolyticum TaxID=3396616 RepID=UPI003F54E225